MRFDNQKGFRHLIACQRPGHDKTVARCVYQLRIVQTPVAVTLRRPHREFPRQAVVFICGDGARHPHLQLKNNVH